MTTSSLKRLRVKKLPSTVNEPQVQYVLELVRGYVKDAKHYAQSRKTVTSLACIAYAEGLLDAIKFLELVDF
jgi:FAD synthetase